MYSYKVFKCSEETFNEFPKWISDQYVNIAKNGGAFLTIYAQDPDLLKDVDPKRVANFQKLLLKLFKNGDLTHYLINLSGV